MKKRRVVRAGVAYNCTHYFIDKGVQARIGVRSAEALRGPRALPVLDAALVQLGRSKEPQTEIWAAATSSIRRTGASPTGALLVAALNEMIDLTTTRTVAALSHPPAVIFWMIFILMLASALVAGQDMATATARHFLHHVAYAVVLSMTVYVILEIEFPRMGLIRIDRFDQLLVDVRNDMR